MNFDEFMDIQEQQHNERFDEMMASKNEYDRVRSQERKWQHDVLQFEKAELEEKRNNIGFGSW